MLQIHDRQLRISHRVLIILSLHRAFSQSAVLAPKFAFFDENFSKIRFCDRKGRACLDHHLIAIKLLWISGDHLCLVVMIPTARLWSQSSAVQTRTNLITLWHWSGLTPCMCLWPCLPGCVRTQCIVSLSGPWWTIWFRMEDSAQLCNMQPAQTLDSTRLAARVPNYVTTVTHKLLVVQKAIFVKKSIKRKTFYGKHKTSSHTPLYRLWETLYLCSAAFINELRRISAIQIKRSAGVTRCRQFLL